MNYIHINIPLEPVVRDSEESSHPLWSRGQTYKRHLTSVAQLPAPYRDRNLLRTGASLGDDYPTSHIRTRLQKYKRMKEGTMLKGKAKRLRTTMELDTYRKGHSARLLAKEIAAKESPEFIDPDDSVVVDDDMTVSESRATFPPSDRNSCRSSIEKSMDIS